MKIITKYCFWIMYALILGVCYLSSCQKLKIDQKTLLCRIWITLPDPNHPTWWVYMKFNSDGTGETDANFKTSSGTPSPMHWTLQNNQITGVMNVVSTDPITIITLTSTEFVFYDGPTNSPNTQYHMKLK